MTAMDIDDEGLDTTDRRLLSAIVQKFGSGPVGGAALAAVIGEEVETVEDVYEPYLLQLGFLDRTPQGRVATERAREHLRALGYEVPPPRRVDRVDVGPLGRRDLPRAGSTRRTPRARDRPDARSGAPLPGRAAAAGRVHRPGRPSGGTALAVATRGLTKRYGASRRCRAWT